MDKNRKLISNKPENYKYIVFDPNYQGVVLTSNDYNEVRNFAQNNKGVHIKYQDTTPKYNNLVTPTWTNRNAYFNQLKKSPDVVILDNKQIERNRAQRQYEENQRRMGVVSKRQDTLRSTEEAEAEQKAKNAYATIQATYNPMAPGYFSANSNTVTPEQAQREITQFYNTTPLGQLTRATAVGSLGGMAFEALPAAAQGALNLEMAYQGAKNLLSDNGVSKTWNKFKSGDYVGGLKSLGGDLFDFTLTLPVASKMLSIGKNSWGAATTNLNNLEQQSKLIPYQEVIYNYKPQEGQNLDFNNPNFKKAFADFAEELKKQRETLPARLSDPSQTKVDYAKLLAQNLIDAGMDVNQIKQQLKLFPLFFKGLPYYPSTLTRYSDAIAEKVYNDIVYPKIYRLLGKDTPTSVFESSRAGTSKYSNPNNSEIQSYIDNAAFKNNIPSTDLMKLVTLSDANLPFEINLTLPGLGSHAPITGNNVINPIYMDMNLPDGITLEQWLKLTAGHEGAGHGTERMIPTSELYKYTIPAKQEYFTKPLGELQANEQMQYVFMPNEVRANIMSILSWLKDHKLEATLENIRLAMNRINEPVSNYNVLSDEGMKWWLDRTLKGYSWMLPTAGTIGASAIFGGNSTNYKNGGKLISRKR